jgi:ATP-dependent DNA helicase PIF1
MKGSQRSMAQYYQDVMSIVRTLGKPDLFAIFTCNPHCREIIASLLYNQKPQDRSDIAARLFKQKLDAIIEDIKKNHIFGVPIAFVYVIEFQKRGFPYAHILIILR